MNESIFIRGSVTSILPTSLSVGTIDTAPLGRSVSSIIFASSNVESGVCRDGLRIIGFPAAILRQSNQQL